MTLAEFVSKNKRLIAAHRGASGEAPENTLAAFNQAIQCGASLVEADVQITKDSVPIVFHDDELGRTASGAGLISEHSYDSLRQLSAGDWFAKKYESEKIPLLSELIEMIKGRAYLALELKPTLDIERKIDCLIDTLHRYDFVSHSILASFDYGALKKVKSIDSKIHTAAIKIPGDDRLPSDLKSELGIEAFVCSVEEISEKLAENIRQSRLIWGVYGIDSEPVFRAAFSAGVNVFGTNYPCQTAKLLESS